MEEKKDIRSLSDMELLQGFLPEKSVENLLREYPSVYDILLHASEKQLSAVEGVGISRTKKLLYVREFLHRLRDKKKKEIQVVRGPEEVMDYFRYLEDKKQEEFWVLMLNTKNHILGSRRISQGTISMAMAGPREVFYAAVQMMAASIIVVHNHPSGDPAPSREDEAVTNRLIKIGKLMDIPVLDHIIIGKYGDCSMKRRNMF